MQTTIPQTTIPPPVVIRGDVLGICARCYRRAILIIDWHRADTPGYCMHCRPALYAQRGKELRP